MKFTFKYIRLKNSYVKSFYPSEVCVYLERSRTFQNVYSCFFTNVVFINKIIIHSFLFGVKMKKLFTKLRRNTCSVRRQV